MNTILSFLSALDKNNNREWFTANKNDYLEAKTVYEAFIDSLIIDLQLIDPRVAGATAKNSVFRIYKDIRFSADKTPYKTHMGAYIIGSGRKSPLPGYYVHIQPGESFLSGGMYQPSTDHLKAIRREIFNFPEDITAIIENPAFRDYYSFYTEDKLKRPPQGYAADAEQIELIKNKHFIASRNFPDSLVTSRDFRQEVLEACRGLIPLNEFLLRAITS